MKKYILKKRSFYRDNYFRFENEKLFFYTWSMYKKYIKMGIMDYPKSEGQTNSQIDKIIGLLVNNSDSKFYVYD